LTVRTPHPDNKQKETYMKFLMLTLILSLTACASMEQQQFASRYLDHSIDNAISDLGQPNRTTELTTGKVYEWDRGGATQVQGSVYRQSAGWANSNATVTERKCTIRMTTDSLAVVNHVVLEGNACN
jgi:hypothetical protein